MIFLFSLLLSVSAWTATAGEPAKPVTEALDRTLSEVKRGRSVDVSPQERRSIAEKALAFLRQRWGVEDPAKAFLKDPKFRAKVEASDPKLSEFVTEFNHLVAQVSAENSMRSCAGYQDLNGSVMSGAANRSHCQEGRTLAKQVILGAQEASIPSYLYTSNLQSLVEVTALDSEQDLPTDSPFLAGVGVDPTLGEKTDRPDPRFLAQLRAESYRRAIQGAVRNALTLKVKYSDAPLTSVARLQREASALAKKYCAWCTDRDLQKMTGSVVFETYAEIKSGRLGWQPPSVSVKKLCDRLKDYGYPFYDSVSASLLNEVIGKRAAEKRVKKRDRMAVLAEVAGTGDEGLLILTESMTNFEGKEPASIRMSCFGNYVDRDEKILKSAVQEALESTEKFARKVSEKVTPSNKTEGEQMADLTELMRFSPRSVGEALLLQPGQAKWVCNAIARVKADDQFKKDLDAAVVWGGTIIGTGLAATGFLAPLGGAVRLAALAFQAGTYASVAAGGYSLYGAFESHRRAADHHDSAIGQGGDAQQMRLSAQEYERFENLATSTALDLGLNALQVRALMRPALSAGATLEEVEDAIKAVRAKARSADPSSASHWVSRLKAKIGSQVVKSGGRRLYTAEDLEIMRSIEEHVERFRPYDSGRFKLQQVDSNHWNAAFPETKVDYVVMLESSPAAAAAERNAIREAYLLDDDGKIMGRIPCLSKKGAECADSQGNRLIPIPYVPPRTVKIVRADGTAFHFRAPDDWGSGDLPSGYRLRLGGEGNTPSIKGSHTARAWQEIQARYPDQVKVLSQEGQVYGLNLDGVRGSIKISDYKYSIGGKPANATKTVYEVSPDAEEALKGYVGRQVRTRLGSLEKDVRGNYYVPIPTSDGKPLKVRVTLSEGNLQSWFFVK